MILTRSFGGFSKRAAFTPAAGQAEGQDVNGNNGHPDAEPRSDQRVAA
ncbi:MAG: hypothetical protein ACRDPK_13640 [Carbonactinosporaceae bacterium]